MKKEELQYFVQKAERRLLELRKRLPLPFRYEPLEITFHLASPITLSHPWMHFDGLIYHLLFREVLGEDYFLLPRKFPFNALQDELDKIQPIKIDSNGLYHASVSFLDADVKKLGVYRKRFEDRWYSGRKKIYRGSGIFRDWSIQHLYLPTSKIRFYVLSDRNMLKVLCELVTGLGNDTRVGWGAVRRFEIRKMEKDCSIVHQGIAMRPIPLFFLEYASEKVPLAWKPPYWARENVAFCAPPGAQVILR